jgi:hypothetical protein
MSRKLALILAAGMVVSLSSFNVQALPVSSMPARTAGPNVTLVRGFCGLGFHREYGYCVRNGTAYAPPPVVVVPPPPVVVAPRYAPPVVVTPSVCPYGYYLGPYGRCLPY